MSTAIDRQRLEPILVTEQLIQPFKFWEDGVQEGMTFKNELFRHYQDFNSQERYEAFELADSIANRQKIQVVITNHPQGYRLWFSLRCCG